MRLVAAMNVRNELDRYLRPCIEHLQDFCEEIRVQDDGSEDGSFEWLGEQDRVTVRRNEGPSWREHEGQLHQRLFSFTLEAEPTHILAIDADEFVVDGEAVRRQVAAVEAPAYGLRMCEVW